ncbi:MAG: phosphoribosylaminoimidazolesuccinocarboxamide synthase [Promethearchaeota archaeon]
MNKDIETLIKLQLDKTLSDTNLPIPNSQLYKGKVRDNYILDDKRIIIATDRLSSFDRVITTIPFKGELLNQVSSFWFEKTKNIVKNHIIEVPDPNISVTHQCETIPIEMIVRAYITGTAWRKYLKGEITSGIELPKGLQKNQKLDDIVLTPSTKAESGHDIYISREQILNENIVDKDMYEQMEEAALKLFEFGQDYCRKNGLILVDTKYEMGLKDGELMVIDEIHTQDSSRFWIADTYNELFSNGQDPEILDKEFFRGWLMTTFPDIFPYIKPDQGIPEIPADVKIELAKRYFKSYNKITGIVYKPEVIDVKERITANLQKAGYL